MKSGCLEPWNPLAIVVRRAALCNENPHLRRAGAKAFARLSPEARSQVLHGSPDRNPGRESAIIP